MAPIHPTFDAQRPFALLIRDRKTGAILFLGRTLDPS
jgi:serine protease inhibitor